MSMGISLIVAVCKCNNGKLGIGYNGEIPWHCPEDLKRFKKITEDCMIIMGRKTFDSIGKALPGRENHILSNKLLLNELNQGYRPGSMVFSETLGSYIWNDIEDLKKCAIRTVKDVVIIGGNDIYSGFMDIVDTIYLTEIQGKYQCDTYFPEISSKFSINSYSGILVSSNGLTFRFIDYVKDDSENLFDIEYNKLVSEIFNYGNDRMDRTNIGTRSIFGYQMKFDISRSIPLLTTKRVAWKTAIRELLWMLCGYTDTKLLEAQGVNIWKGNTSREFLDNLGLKDCPEGDLQFGYGHQIRHSGSLVNGEGGIDQLTRIENLLRHDPFSRRILWSLWSPINLKDCPLNPCHLFFQLYVESIGEDKYLSGHLVMRSNDIACGNPFNIFSYSVLIYILSKRTGMYPKNLIVSLSDAHIYSNHLNDITSQIKRTIRSSPVLYVSDEVINKSYEEMTIDDFDVIGYYPHPTIAYKMAV